MQTQGKFLARLAILATATVAGCSDPEADREAIESLDGLNVIDESNLNEIMLTFADPNQAASYFRNALNNDPDRLEFKQGYARSLMRAKRTTEAVLVYEQIEATGELNDDDRLNYAEALIHNGKWDEAAKQLNAIPPSVETYTRYRLEAMVADSKQDWKRSDHFYEVARGLTTRPAPIFNNWGISKMTRGDYKSAEELFRKAVAFDPKLFNAKNNLALSRAKRNIYELPVVPLTETERAQLYHNIALQAIRNGETQIGRGLLEEAIDTHPQHFPEATAKLAALDGNNVIR